MTGASRGVGRGIAEGLGESGHVVYVTGRVAATLDRTVRAIEELGGEGVAVVCDHEDDAQIEAAVSRVIADRGRIDVLVNNVFRIPTDKRMHGVPFWEQPIALWDDMHGVGLRAHYVASVHAAPHMVRAKRGLIVNVSSFAGGGFQLNVAYGVGKAAVDRLAADMAHDLAPHGVTAIALWPGIVRTEYILEHAASLPFGLEVSESPRFSGRAVAALVADPAVHERTGRRLVVAELAEEYGFDDVDGTRPPSLRAKRKDQR